MLLVMRNLPLDIKYSDIKSLIESKCYVSEIILDKLFKDTPTTKKVTIGVAKEEDAARIMQRLNGTFIGGLQIYIEEVKKSMSGNNSEVGGYQGQRDENPRGGYQKSGQTPWSSQQMGTYQYSYGTPASQMGQAQQGNQPGMGQQSTGYGYGAWMSNNSGITPLMQSNFMGYGNQQGQQLNTSQGQFGGSRPGSQPLGPQKELGFGYSSGNSQNDRERGLSNERSYSNYSGNQNDRGSWRDSQQNRGFGSQQPPDERGTRGYGSGNFGTDTRFGSGNAQADSRGYGSQQPSWGNSNRDGGFDQSRVEDGRDDRKRRHSPEPQNRYSGDSRDRFQPGSSSFAGNQGRGFDSNRDSRESYNRSDPSRDSGFAKPASLLGTTGPYSWSNSSNTSSRYNENKSAPFENKPKPFGGDQSRSFGDKPKPFGGVQSRSFDNKPFGGPQKPPPPPETTKSKIVWNSKYQPPRPQNTSAPPEKRPKIEEKPSLRPGDPNAVVDQKTANRSMSWRGEGISILAKDILKQQGPNCPLLKRGNNNALKWLKRTLNRRIEEIIDEKYPNNPYPPLPIPEVVQLYRSKYPVRTDVKLCQTSLEEALASFKGAQKPAQMNAVPPPTTVKPMAQPSAVPAPKEIKPFKKPTLKDLLPPHVIYTPHPPAKGNLMMRPNAMKKKAKPYNVEKRAKAERKQLAKREFLEEDLYKCPTPEMEKALNAVLDEITDVFNSAVDEHKPSAQIKEEKLVGEVIKQKVAPEFRSTVRLHTIKRILNVTKTLMLRIFVNPGKASRENVEKALKQYGIKNLKNSVRSKTPMFMAEVGNYFNYDRLCSTTGIPVEGKKGPAMLTAKPFHVTIPFKFRRLLKQKKYAELTGDHDDDDFRTNVKYEDDDDDDDDDDEPADDDVIDVTQENDVIELSGDEVKDEKPEVTTEESDVNQAEGGDLIEDKESTVDLTADEDVDEKMSAAIAEEMGDSVVEIDEDLIREDDLEDY